MSDDLKDNYEIYEVEEDISGLDFVEIIIGELSHADQARLQDTKRSDRHLAKAILSADDTELINEVEGLLGDGLDLSAKVFPNPFVDNVVIELLSFTNQSTNLQIYSVDGRLVYNQLVNLHEGRNQIDINLKDEYAGLFYYHISAGDQHYSGKLIKR